MQKVSGLLVNSLKGLFNMFFGFLIIKLTWLQPLAFPKMEFEGGIWGEWAIVNGRWSIDCCYKSARHFRERKLKVLFDFTQYPV
jgi:hypothetical protein